MTRFRAQCPWHGGVTPMLLMCAAVARGGVVDVSDALEYVATPPALGSCYNSTTRYNIIQDLHYWNGKVYAGFGDYSANKGPIPIVAIDPATKETTAELSLGTEEIARFVTDSQGRLWVLCIDQQGSQTYARRPVGGDWEVSTKPSIWYETSKGWNTSGDGNVAMNTHIWDMAQFGDNFFLCGYGFAGSSDDGVVQGERRKIPVYARESLWIHQHRRCTLLCALQPLLLQSGILSAVFRQTAGEAANLEI